MEIDSSVACFADDTRVVRAVSGTDNGLILQEDLNKIHNCAEHNNMAFNDSKFKLLQYGAVRNAPIQRVYLHPTGKEIEKVRKLKDLRVIMEDRSRFDLQAKNRCWAGCSEHSGQER